VHVCDQIEFFLLDLDSESDFDLFSLEKIHVNMRRWNKILKNAMCPLVRLG
jgi:hypothetical protein